MTGLDVHPVEARLLRQTGGTGIPFGQRPQLVVGEDTAVRQRHVLLKQRVPARDARGRVPLRLGIAPGMGRLHHEDRFPAGRPDGPFPDILGQPLERVQIRPGEHKLAGIGPSLPHDGHRLHPDQTGAALGKTAVPPARQLSRAPVESPVTALHGLNHQTVVQPIPGHFQRLSQKGRLLRQGEGYAERGGPSPRLGKRCIAERFFRHVDSPFRYRPVFSQRGRM